MKRIDLLKNRQDKFKEEIYAILDNFLIGSIGKSPSMSGHNLTTKENGKTVTVYVRKAIVPKASQMSKRYNRLWSLLQKLSKVNWELLKIESK
jgi:hypothetical protein